MKTVKLKLMVLLVVALALSGCVIVHKNAISGKSQEEKGFGKSWVIWPSKSPFKGPPVRTDPGYPPLM